MNLTVHRGTNEIGGNCIELSSGKSRILLDFGMPLVNRSGGSFNFDAYKDLSTKELVSQGVLPDVKGAYSEKAEIDGLIISHPHADHYGLMQFLNRGIPVWLGKATHEILKLNEVFLYQNNVISDPHYFEKNKTFQIGDFKITPFWTDHSAFDSYSFLIEARGKSIFYSGDFRAHGRKAKSHKWFLHNAPKNVDYLLLEGTTIGRSTGKYKTEEEIQMEFSDLFNKSESINYIYTSSQNIDRIVSIYKACLSSRKIFVIDVYTANVLDALSEFVKLPSPLKRYSNLKVLFPYKITSGLFNRGLDLLASKFSKHKITKEEISRAPSDYVVLVRSSMKIDLQKITAEGGNLIYSMWDGYKKQPSTKKFLDWLIAKNFKIYDIHTSGHADIETLKNLADTLNPGAIIPIHTFNKQDYKNIFTQKIIELDDNQAINLS